MKSKGLKIALISVSIILAVLIIAFTIYVLWQSGVFLPSISKEELLEECPNIEIPIVEINADGSISKTDKYTNCSFAISNCTNQEYNMSIAGSTDPYALGGVGIRVRGNITARLTARKKAYRVRFNEKTSVLGMRKNKSWVLLADYYDQSSIRNYTAYSLAQEFDNMSFSPSPNHVALIIDGEFMGLYLLCEHVDEEKGRLNVEEETASMTKDDKDYPFHVLCDTASANEDVPKHDYFMLDDWAHFEIKYPDYEDRMEISQGSDSDPVYSYVKEYMSAVFEALNTGKKVNVSFSETPMGLEDLVDINSMIDYYLVNEIMLNCDSCVKSIHLSKKRGEKLTFGPVWDFDWSLAVGDWDLPYDESEIEAAQEIEIAFRSKIFSAFLKNEKYYNMVCSRFHEKKYAILQVADSLRDYKGTINDVALLDAYKWYGDTGKFQFGMQYDYVRLFLYDRYTYLNKAFSLSHKEFLNIKK